MTKKEVEQWNRMRNALRRIAYGYQTASQLTSRGGQYGLEAGEELEMAYENIQQEAKDAARGVRGKSVKVPVESQG